MQKEGKTKKGEQREEEDPKRKKSDVALRMVH